MLQFFKHFADHRGGEVTDGSAASSLSQQHCLCPGFVTIFPAFLEERSNRLDVKHLQRVVSQDFGFGFKYPCENQHSREKERENFLPSSTVTFPLKKNFPWPLERATPRLKKKKENKSKMETFSSLDQRKLSNSVILIEIPYLNGVPLISV